MNTSDSKIKIKSITGFDVYCKANDYVFDPHSTHKKNLLHLSDSSSHPIHFWTGGHIQTPFDRVLFTRPRSMNQPPFMHNRHHNDENVEESRNTIINKNITQYENDPYLHINLKKTQDKINHEKSLFIPTDLDDNDYCLWELIDMKPTDCSEPDVYDVDDDNDNVLDEILQNIKVDEIDPTDQIEQAEQILMPESFGLLKCNHKNTEVDDSFYERDSSLTAIILFERALFQRTCMLISIIKTMIANTIYEKVVQKINNDISRIGGFNAGTFWMSIVNDNAVEHLYYANIIRRKYHKFNHQHQNIMIENVSKLIKLCDDDKSKHLIFAKLFKDEISDSPIGVAFDRCGMIKYLVNHPFMLYCVVENKLQLYKFFITSLTSDKIQYELYQIDKISTSTSTSNISDNIDITSRPHIITRDITNKFSFDVDIDHETPHTNAKQNIKHKFAIDCKKLNIDIISHDITSANSDKLHLQKFLQKLNGYTSDWATLLNVIITDATKCIKAFISNKKKKKIDLDFNMIDQKVCEKILNELQTRSIDTVNIESETTYDKLFNKLNTKYFESNFYSSTRTYRDYHPMSYITRILQTRKLESVDHIKKLTNENSLPLFTDRYKTIDKIMPVLADSDIIVYEKFTKRVMMRDLLFIFDDTNDSYHHINGICSNNLNESTLIDMKIKSNCPLKLYLRVEQKFILVGEGNNIYVPIIPSYVANAVFFKLSSDPDTLIETLSQSSSPPYVTISFTILKSPPDDVIDHEGFILDFITEDVQDQTTTVLYVNRETDETDNRKVYFGVIRDINHLKSIENLIY